MDTVDKIGFVIKKIFGWVLVLFFIIFFFGGIVISVSLLISHIYFYFKNGQWPILSILDFLGKINPVISGWNKTPSDWIGLHNILVQVPAWLAMLIACPLIGYLFAFLNSKIDKNK